MKEIKVDDVMKPITSLDLVSINADEKVSDAWKKIQEAIRYKSINSYGK